MNSAIRPGRITLVSAEEKAFLAQPWKRMGLSEL